MEDLLSSLLASSSSSTASKRAFTADMAELQRLFSFIQADFTTVRSVVMSQRSNNDRRAISKPEKSRRDNWATVEELTRQAEARDKFNRGAALCNEALSVYSDIREEWGDRQETALLKKQKAQRHCTHCAGNAAPCGCRDGCARKNSAKCIART